MENFVLILVASGAIIIISILIFLLIANFNDNFADILLENERIFYVIVAIGALFYVLGPILYLFLCVI
jgi:hypothetical protein